MLERRRGIFEKIGIFIPGYIGYSQREGRRNTDKLLRESFAKELTQQKKILNDKILELTNLHALQCLSELDKASRRLEKIIDKLRHASYGASGFFDLVQIGEEELDKLYRYDLSLTGKIELLVKSIKNLQDKKDEKEILTETQTLLNILNEIDIALDNRKEILLEVK